MRRLRTVGSSCALVLAVARRVRRAAARRRRPMRHRRDAPPDDAADAFAACREFDGDRRTTVPVHVDRRARRRRPARARRSATRRCAVRHRVGGPRQVVELDGLVARHAVRRAASSRPADLVVLRRHRLLDADRARRASECLLFEDASTGGDEVGHFVATGTSVYVVVDYYASHAPTDGDVHARRLPRSCTTRRAVHRRRRRCASTATASQCASSFDCTDPPAAALRHDEHTCERRHRPVHHRRRRRARRRRPRRRDRARARRRRLRAARGQICSQPASEARLLRVRRHVARRDLGPLARVDRLARPRSRGRTTRPATALGLSYWEQPEHVAPDVPRRSAATTSRSASSRRAPDPTAVELHADAHRTPAPAARPRPTARPSIATRSIRGDCVAGACVAIDGGGAVHRGRRVRQPVATARPGCRARASSSSRTPTRATCARATAARRRLRRARRDYVCTTYLAARTSASRSAPTTRSARPSIEHPAGAGPGTG